MTAWYKEDTSTAVAAAGACQQILRVLLELQQQHGFALVVLSYEESMAQDLKAQVKQIQAGQTQLP